MGAVPWDERRREEGVATFFWSLDIRAKQWDCTVETKKAMADRRAAQKYEFRFREDVRNDSIDHNLYYFFGRSSSVNAKHFLLQNVRNILNEQNARSALWAFILNDAGSFYSLQSILSAFVPMCYVNRASIWLVFATAYERIKTKSFLIRHSVDEIYLIDAQSACSRFLSSSFSFLLRCLFVEQQSCWPKPGSSKSNDALEEQELKQAYMWNGFWFVSSNIVPGNTSPYVSV